MRAIVISEPGPPEVLRLAERRDPVAGPGQLLVRVAATSVNRADLLQRQGHYPAPPGSPDDIPGLEYAGTVEAVGEGADRWKEGDRVMGLVGGGGYAELVAVPASQAMGIPESLSLEQAAAVPEVFITAHDALGARLHLRAGETLLIHAVGSGVGTAALQLAKALGCPVIGTSRTPWKLARARELGLDLAVDASSGEWSRAVRDATDGRGVEAILDLVGGAYLKQNLRTLATLGRQVVVGLTAGRTAEIDLGAVLAKRITIVGTALRSRSPAEKAEVASAFEREVVPLLRSGAVRPIVHDVLPMRDAARAHALLESNRTFGSVVLRW
ncbi:MAG TPA: NAD(P)H-quinone oxidoreductase [Longimicrobiales bacterium]|nr:NAD(P)H-quinone oxidoreductase [Longimicrobiales bacterium]